RSRISGRRRIAFLSLQPPLMLSKGDQWGPMSDDKSGALGLRQPFTFESTGLAGPEAGSDPPHPVERVWPHNHGAPRQVPPPRPAAPGQRSEPKSSRPRKISPLRPLSTPGRLSFGEQSSTIRL